MFVNIPVSVGELFDKISILEIKKNKLINKDNIKTVKFELDKLNMIVKKKRLSSKQIKNETTT